MRRRNGQGETISSATSLLMAGRIPMVLLIQTLAVAEHLNFRHAANVLGVTQSSISARVKALEEMLGIQPFERRIAFQRSRSSNQIEAAVDRGRPRATSAKVQVTLRLDPDVVNSYRKIGSGWQTRLNEDLRKARKLEAS